MESKIKLNVQLDSSPLITFGKYKVGKESLMRILLNHVNVIITEPVEREVVGAKATPDASEIRALIKKGAITVVPAPAAPIIRDFYPALSETDCGVIRYGLTRPELLTVIDDREAFVVGIRFGLEAPSRVISSQDLIVGLAREGGLTPKLAQDMVQSCASRFSPYYVAHTMAMLEELEK